jgi:putative oxidoreductase
MTATAPPAPPPPSVAPGSTRATLLHGALPLAARILISAIFIQAALGKIMGWSSQAAYMASHNLPFITPLLAIALVIEVVGVVCLITGYRTRAAAFIMFLYLIALSVLLHNFWAYSDPEVAGMLQTHFMKNMGIAGGLLMLTAYGPGLWALRPSHMESDRSA